MSNLRIGDVEDVVLPRFSDIKIGTFYKYQGLDGFRLKIDEYYFYDLERKMKGVENHHWHVTPYRVEIDVKDDQRFDHPFIAFHAIEIGEFCKAHVFDDTHLVIKISNSELFDMEYGQLIEVDNKDCKFDIPVDVCMNFYVNLDEITITDVNRK